MWGMHVIPIQNMQWRRGIYTSYLATVVAEDLRKAVPRDFVAKLKEIRQKKNCLECTGEMKAAFLE